MKILVLISNVPDTTTKVKFKDNKFDTTGVQWIINPWDELALTRALELKKASNGKIEKVAVAMVAPKSAEPTIRKALAMGADEAYRIDTEPKDSYSTAVELAEALKDKDFDLIMAGLESSDYNGLSVGAMLAELLGINSVSAVSGLDFDGEKFIVKRDIEGGYEKLTVQTPFVAVVQKGIAIVPLIPNMRGIMMAKRKPIHVIEAKGIEPLVEMVEFELPKPKPPVKLVETAEELINLLHNEAKVI